VCLEQALAALSHLPESRDMLEQAIDLGFDLRNAFLPLGDSKRIAQAQQQAERLAEALDDKHRLGRISLYMMEYFRVEGDPDRAVESGQRAPALASSLGDERLQIVANFFLGSVHYTLGNYGRAIQHFRMTVAALHGELSRERFGMMGLPAVLARRGLACCLAELGAFDEGFLVGEGGVRIAEAVDQPFSLDNAYAGSSFVYLGKGDFNQAIAVLERGLALCQRWNIQLWFPTAASALGYAYVVSERFAEGISLLEQAVGFGRKSGDQVLWSVRLSEAYLLAGRSAEARHRDATRRCPPSRTAVHRHGMVPPPALGGPVDPLVRCRSSVHTGPSRTAGAQAGLAKGDENTYPLVPEGRLRREAFHGGWCDTIRSHPPTHRFSYVHAVVQRAAGWTMHALTSRR
jgi:tetratricopeptide (TPR) repeat protein